VNGSDKSPGSAESAIRSVFEIGGARGAVPAGVAAT
jgi:hypothetical protein